MMKFLKRFDVIAQAKLKQIRHKLCCDYTRLAKLNSESFLLRFFVGDIQAFDIRPDNFEKATIIINWFLEIYNARIKPE